MERKLGVYVHWPFCKTLCPYCDFNSYVFGNIDETLWLQSYLMEFRALMTKMHHSDYVVSSIFFGGGTPSLMSQKIIVAIINAVVKNFKVASNLEITVECNPSTTDMRGLMAFKEAGINRVSLGVQALRDEYLKFLGRTHTVLDALSAIDIVAKHFNNYSIDLMYGYGNQTCQEWEHDLLMATKLARNHISVYNLTIERGTEFFALHMRNKLLLPTSSEINKMHNITQQILTQFGLQRYEISNYATSRNYRSVHNLLYWQVEDYLGLGPGAHGRIIYSDMCRMQTMTHHSPNKWLNMIQRNGHGLQTVSHIKLLDQIKEILLMGLRITDGINIKKLEERLNIKLDCIMRVVEELLLIRNDILSIKNGHIIPTNNGIDIVNTISKFILREVNVCKNNNIIKCKN